MKLFHSTGLRLAAAYTLAFALAVVVLGVVTIAATRSALERELDGRIEAESKALTQEYRTEGLRGVVQAVRERDRTPGALDYGLRDASGTPIAGRLAHTPALDGWSMVQAGEPPAAARDVDRLRVLSVRFETGERLMVGEDLERITTLDGLILRSFGWAFLGVVLLGGGAGLALSADIERRFGDIATTAKAIIGGDLRRRIPLKGRDDDLDDLARTLNQMLDRIAALMETLKQVSNDIAHDLRTPLTRLRQKLEESLGAPSEQDRVAVVQSALGDVDAILEIFAALLRIAQIEGGARRSAFQPLDLAEIASGVVEAFAPSAEEGGRTLLVSPSSGAAHIKGDRELLIQMLANLIENGLTHTPRGSTVEVTTGSVGDDALLCIRDDGPGVPPSERPRLFDRFVRLEHSRTTPGSGLGLALVAAVARLHEATVDLDDAGPGLLVRIRFRRAAP